MVIIKKFASIKLSTERVNDSVNIKLSYGETTGPYYSRSSPDEEHDTEEEAIQYAHEQDKWATWMIVPIIRFDNF